MIKCMNDKIKRNRNNQYFKCIQPRVIMRNQQNMLKTDQSCISLSMHNPYLIRSLPATLLAKTALQTTYNDLWAFGMTFTNSMFAMVIFGC